MQFVEIMIRAHHMYVCVDFDLQTIKLILWFEDQNPSSNQRKRYLL